MFRQSTNQNRVVMTSLDGINGWSIQTWLRGENDWKQSDEILPPPPTPRFIPLVCSRPNFLDELARRGLLRRLQKY